MLDVHTCYVSEQGGRSRNEDACGYWTSEDACCWVVSDGAGGHGSGDVASRLVVSTVLRRFAAHPVVAPDAAVALLQAANEMVVTEKTNGDTADDMHATAVALLIDPRRGLAVWGHVGDSRIYLFRRGHLAYQTRDHSLVQNMIDAGFGSVSMIRTHPKRSLLTSAIGAKESIALSVSAEPLVLQPGDVFLMCTDGWWEYVEEPEMERLLDEATTPEAWLTRMGELIRQRAPAENDNYTAVCVKLTEETTVILPGKGHDPAVSD
ncbi:PP2C family protein-serine/threonine phosphatase [Zoogloea sp.]|uniref:PP2C family protein-serine/threonine phosphatase n=1 Tax=Zoogloea sp. TaxID=49181 RepID=UPI002634777B|nr:PP2C family serine/threonine-protein phosphatase [uncultured Zoogloea sp.]